MDREKDLTDFITRCQAEFVEELEKLKTRNREFTKRHNKKETTIESRKKYLNSEKGKYASSKCRSKRKNKIRNDVSELDWHEKKLIGRFYLNCPEGYEVDHIIPLAKGGKHVLSNLQYLTKEENRSKCAKIDWWDNSFCSEIGMKEEAENYLWNRIPCSCLNQMESTRFIINEMVRHEMINSRHSAYKTLRRWVSEGKYAYGRTIDLGWKVCKINCII